MWTETQENAFQHLKSKLIRRPVLQYPDFLKEFILTTDASNSRLGAVLSQGPVGVMNVKDPGSRLRRWRMQLAEYD